MFRSHGYRPKRHSSRRYRAACAASPRLQAAPRSWRRSFLGPTRKEVSQYPRRCLRLLIEKEMPARHGRGADIRAALAPFRSEEHTSELQSLMRISYAVFCLKKQKQTLHSKNRHINVHNTRKIKS